ncbi:hypothetical protein C8F01DRAFT_1261612 [Mycena amicta]|nr:hypothetical protein C8F01DRAFT_1261612 [Mycena amicta]
MHPHSHQKTDPNHYCTRAYVTRGLQIPTLARPETWVCAFDNRHLSPTLGRSGEHAGQYHLCCDNPDHGRFWFFFGLEENSRYANRCYKSTNSPTSPANPLQKLAPVIHQVATLLVDALTIQTPAQAPTLQSRHATRPAQLPIRHSRHGQPRHRCKARACGRVTSKDCHSDHCTTHCRDRNERYCSVHKTPGPLANEAAFSDSLEALNHLISHEEARKRKEHTFLNTMFPLPPSRSPSLSALTSSSPTKAASQASSSTSGSQPPAHRSLLARRRHRRSPTPEDAIDLSVSDDEEEPKKELTKEKGKRRASTPPGRYPSGKCWRF